MICRKCGTQNSQGSNFCSNCGITLNYVSHISKRGFASMDHAKRSEIAKKGGVMAHKLGRAHQYTSEEASAAGKKGGNKKKKTTPKSH